MTTVHSKVYIVTGDKERVRGTSQPCTECSNCLEVNCGHCLACREIKSNPGIFNAVCYKRRCSGENPDKPVETTLEDSVEKLLQSPRDGDIIEVQKMKERKRKLEKSSSTIETLKRRKSPGKSLQVSEETNPTVPLSSTYNCYKCPFTMTTRSELYEHYSLKHFYAKIIKKFRPQKVCPNCNFDISSKDIWVCHLGTKHNTVDLFLPEKYKVPVNS